MKYPAIVLAILLLILLSAGRLPAWQDVSVNSVCADSLLFIELQNVLEESRAEQQVPGVSAALKLASGSMWAGASGISGAQPPDSVQTGMLFSIASITKTFISALTLKLVEDGDLSLEDSLCHLLPPFPQVDSTATVRQLLNHTSGIFSFHEHPAFWDSIFTDPERFWTPEDIIANFMFQPYFPPGEGWHYSNTNYLLLGMIIREICGEPPHEVLRSRIYEPWNLEDTYLYMAEEVDGELVHGWLDIDHDGELEDISDIPPTARYSAIWTGGAMVSTAADVARWIDCLYNAQVLEAETFEEMLQFEDVPFAYYPIDGYGLGVQRFEISGRIFWGHDGDIPGFNSVALHSPQDGFSLVVLVNANANDAASEIAFCLLETVLEYLSVDDRGREAAGLIPRESHLWQNYPNPLNSSASIRFLLPAVSRTSLSIYDISGRRMRDFDFGLKDRGYHRENIHFGDFPAGTYLMLLKAGNRSECARVVIVR